MGLGTVAALIKAMTRKTDTELAQVKTDITKETTSGEVEKKNFTGTSPYKNTNLEGKTISKLLNNNVAGILVISGKNICDFNPIDETITKNGKTVTVKSQADGSILVNGEYVSANDAYIPLITDEYELPAGMTFTISQNMDVTEGLQIIYSNRGISSGTTRTVTLNTASLCNAQRNMFRISNGAWTFNNVVFKPQVEIGSSATTWEKYDGKHVTASASDAETSVNYKCGSTMVAIWNGNASVTLQTEEYEYIGYNGYANVIRKGAKGDGVTDDSDVLQDVINKNRKVYIPSGKYLITKTIIIPSNTEVMGDGVSTEFICLGTASTLTPFQWSTDYGDDNYFYPYIVANEATNVIVRDIYIHGNLTTEDQHIHTGMCFYDSDFCVADNVKITRVNYFPDNSPLPRPSGQWRRGWAISMFYCSNVEVKSGEFTYSPYENVRVGKNCKNVYVHDCVIKYGWRTGLQILRGCDGVVVERCEIIQDDFDTYDTRACITIHTAEDNHIKNVIIRDCKLIGDLWSANGDSGGISIVGYYCENLLVENNIFRITGAAKCIDALCENIRIYNNDMTSTDDEFGVILCAYTGFSSRVEFVGNKLTAKGLGVQVHGVGTKEIIIDNNTIKSSNNHAVYIGGNDAITATLTAKGNKFVCGDTSHNGMQCTSNATVNGSIIGNTCGTCQYGARVLGGSGVVVVGNDFHSSTSGIVCNGTGNVTGNNAVP